MDKLAKRHFYNKKNYELDYENKVLKLFPDFHNLLLDKKLWNKFGFKKIGGSSLGNVLKVDKFKSEFEAFANICWLGVPILDRKYVDAGIDIEPKVIDVLKTVLKCEIEVFEPEKYNYDYFSGRDDVIGGIPDGFIKDRKIILEIKTTGEKNFDNWNKFGVPISYLKQAELYAYLMGVKEYWIVATFLKENDYEDSKNYPIKKRIVKNYKYSVNESSIRDDIKKIKDWYYKYTKLGFSPKWDPVKDKDLIEYLSCTNEEEYKSLLDKWKQEGKLKLSYE